MSRPAKGARLHKFKHRPHWYIRDTGQSDRSTGCTSRVEAEKALGAYIATKGRTGSAHEPENVTCGDVLTIYAEEYAPSVAAPERIGYAMDALLPFWADLKLTHVKGETCRRYGILRARAPATIRRELGTLQAAMNYAHREGYVTAAPLVTLPEAPEGKERWLTRNEAAKLVWAAYRGQKTPYLARFILIAIYTGTRKDAILRMSFEPNTLGGWFDLDNGIMFRRGSEERVTNKRRTPAPIPRQLKAHLTRWQRLGSKWAVDYQGGRVGDIKRSFNKARQEAGMPEVTPHTLKHTAITWALQNGATVWDCAGYFATSVETIQKVYGHHATDFMQSALGAVERKRS